MRTGLLFLAFCFVVFSGMGIANNVKAGEPDEARCKMLALAYGADTSALSVDEIASLKFCLAITWGQNPDTISPTSPAGLELKWTESEVAIISQSEIKRIIGKSEIIGEWKITYMWDSWSDSKESQISFYSDGVSAWTSWGNFETQVQPWTFDEGTILFRVPEGNVIYEGRVHDPTSMSGIATKSDARASWSAIKNSAKN